MPRKKLAKRVVKATPSAATLVQLEKDFSTLPAKLATEIKRELSALKKKESELKKAVAQTSAGLKATESTIKAAAKEKKTAAGKKRLAKAKKTLQEATKIHRALVSELNNISKSISSLISKATRVSALRKALVQFDKDWAKKAKKMAKSTKKVKTKRAAKKSARLAVIKDDSEKSHIESFNTSVENVTLDRTAESAS